MKILLTNDDGIHAAGLQTLRRALAALAPPAGGLPLHVSWEQVLAAAGR